MREDFPDGAVQTGLVSGGAGGRSANWRSARSGLGDGLVGFRAGPLGNAAIVAAQVRAPPAQFVVSVPKGWIRPTAGGRSPGSRRRAPTAPLRYQVVLDGRRLGDAVRRARPASDPRGLGNGTHRVQVLATDIDGQLDADPAGDAAASIRRAPTVRLVARGAPAQWRCACVTADRASTRPR